MESRRSIANLSQALMINRNTVSYHVKRMQTSGLIDREETDGLRLVRASEGHDEGLANALATPMTPKTALPPPQGLNITNSIDTKGGS